MHGNLTDLASPFHSCHQNPCCVVIKGEERSTSVTTGHCSHIAAIVAVTSIVGWSTSSRESWLGWVLVWRFDRFHALAVTPIYRVLTELVVRCFLENQASKREECDGLPSQRFDSASDGQIRRPSKHHLPRYVSHGTSTLYRYPVQDSENRKIMKF